MLIEDSAAFEEILQECRRQRRIAFDTEFIRERRFKPQLCLIQLAVGDQVVAVDPFEVAGLDPLVDLLVDPDVLTIVHAGQQDMEIFFAGTDALPSNVFDTQIAAALLGYGDSIGYSRLVEELEGVRLSKAQTFTDWARRPLSDAQIRYALDDVIHLPSMCDKLTQDLDATGRRSWLEEELRVYEDPFFYRRDPATLYRRVKGAARLNRRELAVLRELARWREVEAERRDRPRNHIVADEVLVELARTKPRQIEKLRGMRGLHPQLVKRSAKAIVRAVGDGVELPPEEHPAPIEKSSKDPALGLVVDLLETFLKARAQELRIGAGYLATRTELHELARRQRAGEIERDDEAARDIRALRGWRRELIGEDLIGLLEGRYHVGIAPQDGSVVIHAL